MKNQTGYYCSGCEAIYIGEPIIEDGIVPNYDFAEGGFYCDDDYTTRTAYRCHDDPPCTYYDDEFVRGNVAELMLNYGVEDIGDVRGHNIDDDAWVCGDCEKKYYLNYWGEDTAKQLAIGCCQ